MSVKMMWFPEQTPQYVHLLLLCSLLLARCVFAAAESEQEATGRPTLEPKLPLGDINIVVLTDTHSWVGGHAPKEDYNVDYGDVLSFYQILQHQVDALNVADPDHHQHDLFFVMNGDWIDGTGLAMNGDPTHLMPLLEKMPWDAVNVGNHELYRRSVIEHIVSPGGFSEWWGGKYLSSNIVLTDKVDDPLGNKYTYLIGQHSTTLAFGFLYNMNDNDPLVTVKTVQETISEAWFEQALMTEGYDAILVLAHMDHRDSLIQVILERIRTFVDHDMPIQFVTGHTHYRGQSDPDDFSSSFEAGRYLDTIGFVSFPKQTTIRAAADYAKDQAEIAAQEAAEEAAAAATSNMTDCLETHNSTTDCLEYNATGIEDESTSTVYLNETTIDTVKFADTFEHVFIDAKYTKFQEILGMENVVTNDGVALSVFIEEVQKDLGLFQVVGCVEKDYRLEKSMDEPDSLWGLFCNHVVPLVFPWEQDKNHSVHPTVVLLDKGSWRYDLLAKEVTLDEVIGVSPFNDSLSVFLGVPSSVVTTLNATLNENGPGAWMTELPEWVMCFNSAPYDPEPNVSNGSPPLYDLVTAGFSLDSIRQALDDVWPNASSFEVPESQLIPNHTTTSIWLQFLDETKMCQTEHKGSQKKPPKDNDASHHANGPNAGENGKSEPKPGEDALVGEALNDKQRLDKERIIFVWIAGFIVLGTLGMYVRKRARRYQSKVQAQELASLRALEEYNEQQQAKERYYDRNFFDNSNEGDTTTDLV